MPVCPHCGHDTADPDARFCPACGRALTSGVAGPGGESADATSTLGAIGREPDSAEPEAAESLDAGVVERLQPGTALLLVRSGPSSGARFLLDADSTTAGRHPDSDIFLDDITVSRRHVQFVREGGRFRIHDAGSLNGTYVNRSRIDDTVLNNGDEVQIGKYRLVFLAPPSAGTTG
ncbi:MAG TPA: FHA domain-containing protein [Actinomycetes bacterium]|nr:FHA domain-containing protein [Actinomycetes bacterium]